MSTTNVDKIKCTDRSGRATWRKDNFRKQTSKTFHRHTHVFPPERLSHHVLLTRGIKEARPDIRWCEWVMNLKIFLYQTRKKTRKLSIRAGWLFHVSSKQKKSGTEIHPEKAFEELQQKRRKIQLRTHATSFTLVFHVCRVGVCHKASFGKGKRRRDVVAQTWRRVTKLGKSKENIATLVHPRAGVVILFVQLLKLENFK